MEAKRLGDREKRREKERVKKKETRLTDGQSTGERAGERERDAERRYDDMHAAVKPCRAGALTSRQHQVIAV